MEAENKIAPKHSTDPVIRQRRAEFYAALRSGKFTQCEEVLEEIYPGNDQARNCCLGVGCRVAIRQGLKLASFERFQMTYFGGLTVDTASNSVLPSSVRAWFDFDDKDPIIGRTVSGARITATFANDGDDDGDIPKHSFIEIANLFEAAYPSS